MAQIFDEGNIDEIDDVLVIHKIFPTKYIAISAT